MEGKAVIVSVLVIMSLVMAQMQVEAEICCPNEIIRDRYDFCLIMGGGERACANACGCIATYGGDGCPEGYLDGNLKYSGDAINKYCKLGCASSVCGGALTTLQNSASEIIKGVVEQCSKDCSTLCSKGSSTDEVKSA